MKKLLYIFLLSALNTFATPPLDSNYVKDLSNSLIIRLLGISKFSSVAMQEGLREVIYVPVSGINAGVGFAYKWIGINLTVPIPGTNFFSGNAKSKGLDLRIHSYGRRFGFDASYSTLSGFALDKISAIPNAPSMVTFRPDLYTEQFAFTGYFNLNPSKFSLRAVTLQNERQLKSAGAPIGGIYVNHLKFGTTDSTSIIDPSLIPQSDAQRYFNKSLHFKKIQSFNIGLHFGYIYSLIIKKHFFASLGANLGAGYDNSKYSYLDQQPKIESELLFFVLARLAIGYNTDNFYAGFVINQESNILIVKENSVLFSHGTLRLVIAKRFSGKFNFLNKLYRTRMAKTLAPKDKK